MFARKEWIDSILNGGKAPFTFSQNGEKVCPVNNHVNTKDNEGILTYTILYEALDGDLNIELEIVDKAPLDMLTYRFRLHAARDIDMPIESLTLFDWQEGTDTTPVLRHWNGAANWLDDGTYPHHNFQIRDTEMKAGQRVELETIEGRAACDYLPFWVLSDNASGLWFGPEWSGTWAFEASNDGGQMRVQFTLPFMHFTMKQGEELEFPAFSMGGFKGDVWDGCLQMRRCIREDFMPEVDGKVEDPQLIYQVLGGPASRLNAEGIAREFEVLKDIGAESWVYATPYYRPCLNSSKFDDFREVHPNMGIDGKPDTWANWWETCGDFKPHPERFPEGGPAHGEKLGKHGMRWGWWIDPRVAEYADVFEESRKDCLLPFKAKEPERKHEMWNMRLIDTGSEAGQRYLYEMLEGFIANGSRWIWHDLNVELRERYWWHLEEEDRRGIMELKYHMGMNAVFDKLIREYPDIRVEWCASGGTMINLGILRRCHTMWVTDHTGLDIDDEGNAYSDTLRTFRSFLHWILPASYIMNCLRVGRPEGKNRRSTPEFLVPQMGSTMTFDQYILDWDDVDQANVKEAASIFKKYRRLLNKDFYGLFKPPRALDEWDGWQFHDPETGEGLIYLFRGHDCKEENATINPKWISPEGVHFNTLIGEIAEWKADGADIKVHMPDKAAIVHYKQ